MKLLITILMVVASSAVAQEEIFFRWSPADSGAVAVRYEVFSEHWNIGETDTSYVYRWTGADTTCSIAYTEGRGMRIHARGVSETGVSGDFSEWSDSYFGHLTVMPCPPTKPSLYKIEFN